MKKFARKDGFDGIRVGRHAIALLVVLTGCIANEPEPEQGDDCAAGCEGAPPESQCVWTCQHTPEAEPGFQPDPLPW
jgi:hypothetical protein